jgi:hypothetical protein
MAPATTFDVTAAPFTIALACTKSVPPQRRIAA